MWTQTVMLYCLGIKRKQFPSHVCLPQILVANMLISPCFFSLHMLGDFSLTPPHLCLVFAHTSEVSPPGSTVIFFFVCAFKSTVTDGAPVDSGRVSFYWLNDHGPEVISRS